MIIKAWIFKAAIKWKSKAKSTKMSIRDRRVSMPTTVDRVVRFRVWYQDSWFQRRTTWLDLVEVKTSVLRMMIMDRVCITFKIKMDSHFKTKTESLANPITSVQNQTWMASLNKRVQWIRMDFHKLKFKIETTREIKTRPQLYSSPIHCPASRSHWLRRVTVCNRTRNPTQPRTTRLLTRRTWTPRRWASSSSLTPPTQSQARLKSTRVSQCPPPLRVATLSTHYPLINNNSRTPTTQPTPDKCSPTVWPSSPLPPKQASLHPIQTRPTRMPGSQFPTSVVSSIATFSLWPMVMDNMEERSPAIWSSAYHSS